LRKDSLKGQSWEDARLKCSRACSVITGTGGWCGLWHSANRLIGDF